MSERATTAGEQAGGGVATHDSLAATAMAGHGHRSAEAPGAFGDPGGCLEPPEERRRPLRSLRPLILLLLLTLVVGWLLTACGDTGSGSTAGPSDADGATGGIASTTGAAQPSSGPSPVAADEDVAVADAVPARPHVLLISIDTLRADHLGCYGHERDTSPWIDSLAERGVRVEQAYAQATMTLSSHASLLTSLYPPQFGLVRNDGVNVNQAHSRLRLPAAVDTLAEQLAAAGYRTAAFTGGALVDPRFGLGQGFEHFQAAVGYEQSGLATSMPWLLDWLDRVEAADDERPLFLFLHTFDAHDPYRAPAPFADAFSRGDDLAFQETWGLAPNVPSLTRQQPRPDAALLEEVEALYDNGIRYVDDRLAALEAELTARGLWDDMLVVLVSDHGEEFHEHGGWGHGPRPHREVLHVPWILRWPGDRFAGTVVAGALPLLDVAPTVVEALDLPLPSSWRGRSLLPHLADGAPLDTSRLLYADNQDAARDTRRVQDGQHVLLLDYSQFGQQLFARADDPDELRDLSSGRQAEAAALRQRFESWLGELIGASRAFVAEPMPDQDETHWEAQREMLEALGYVR